ncbi:MAG TPA: polysaccharide biosynthesis protein, partial [Blastocatellia bacterium]|nr:polysaccharide biosynthesis protein [Blastocatellia bacterium]
MIPVLALRLTLPEPHGAWRVPITVIVMDTVLAFGSVLVMRVLRRVFYENYERQGRIRRWGPENDRRKDSVLLIGAGRAGVLAAREIQSRPDANVRIRGFIDDDPQKRGALLHGIKVIGTTQDLPRLAAELEIDHVIITIANATRQELRHIIDVCESASLKVRIIPSYHDVVQGKVEVSNIRDVQIEDLLGRDPVQLDEEVIGTFLAGKTVMVTGAGGSIGSELARQISRFNPARLLLVERAEFVLFNIDRELRELWPELTVIPLVADVGDEARMRSLFAEYRPQVVLHAAAHKHVPMMESNPSEAVKNNILATKIVGELAGAFDAEA